MDFAPPAPVLAADPPSLCVDSSVVAPWPMAERRAHLTQRVGELTASGPSRYLVTLPAIGSGADRALHLAFSPDIASDSVDHEGCRRAVVRIRLRAAPSVAGTPETLAFRPLLRPPVVPLAAPFRAPRQPLRPTQRFCALYVIVSRCATGRLVYRDRAYAYYEDTRLQRAERATRTWYEAVARVNAITEPILQRLWGVPSDVDGSGRLHVFVTRSLPPGVFMWNNCVGPGPVPRRAPLPCMRTGVQEWFTAGTMGAVARTHGIRASAAWFALTQTTDAQEYTLWTHGSRFPGSVLQQGIWQSATYRRHTASRAGWDPSLGNGLSLLTLFILSQAGDSLGDGTGFRGPASWNGWRESCLARLRACHVHGDRYYTPGMFGYWLWQQVGDGLGARYTQAVFGDYHGDLWEQAVGVRGAALFNRFFLATLLDDTPIGRASGLEWPESAVPERLPDVRAQRHDLPIDSTGEYVAAYSGPQVVRMAGLTPGMRYLLDIDIRSTTRTTVTVVTP